MLEIVRGDNEKPVSTNLFTEAVQDLDINGYLFLGYPIINNSINSNSLDALLISPELGIKIIDIVESADVTDRIQVRDNLYNILYSRFIVNHKLVESRRQLSIEPDIITFAPAWHQKFLEDSSEELISKEELVSYLKSQLNIKSISIEVYKKYLEAIQSITTLTRKSTRQTESSNSKGAILNKLEDSISNLDRQQSKAVIETVRGIQRIRGLAGSGKTIVLALKVAYLHSRFPDWDIGVTFYTRALRNVFIELITKFTIEQKREEPDWSKINILHAWGGPRMDGIYYTFCRTNNIEYLDYQTADNRFNSADLLGEISNLALEQVQEATGVFDIVLIDEAQDFSESFLKLCYEMIRPHNPNNIANRRLIYAYDELQNLNNTTLRSPKEIFGSQIDFTNDPDKPQQDVILDVCYRNFPQVLATAHALGFGIYRDGGLVTMFKEKELWTDVGYIVEDGQLELGSKVKLKRNPNAIPELLNEPIDENELINFSQFDNQDEQILWIANQIKKNIEEDELRHKDIIVIHPNAYRTKPQTARLRQLLFDNGINNHLAGVDTSKEDFFLENSVAFTSIYRAKGNEAPMVYIMNAEYCYEGYELIKKRNILFTAITRSKCWIRVCGLRDRMGKLIEEFEKVKQNNFHLDFKYPTEDEMDNLNTIHRDLTLAEKKDIKEADKELNNLLSKIENEKIKKEDIDPKKLEMLRRLLDND